MKTVKEIRQEENRKRVYNRLKKGAKILGRLFKKDVPCSWGYSCDCSQPTQFCVAKLKWIDLFTAWKRGARFSAPGVPIVNTPSTHSYRGYEPWKRDNPCFDLLEDLPYHLFVETGLTLSVKLFVKGECCRRETIGGLEKVHRERGVVKLGPNGTDLKTLEDAFSNPDHEVTEAVKAIEQIQRVFGQEKKNA